MIEEQDAEQEGTIPGRFELKPTLEKVWHAPDNFHFMDSLPPTHRRRTTTVAVVLVVGLLPPSDDTPDASVVMCEVQLDIQPQSQSPIEEQLWAQLVTPQNDPDQAAPVAPEPMQGGRLEEQPQTTHMQPFQSGSGTDSQWCSYRVRPGKTMTQLFRDHGLPATDVYAMAQVEGVDKPLGNLQNGQMAKIRQNASGIVAGLITDAGNNQQVLSTRRPDGSFIRARQMKGQLKAS